MEERVLREQLGLVEGSLGFLLILIASLLLSFAATFRQRQAVCLSIRGETEAAERVGEVYPLRRTAGAMVIGCLGYFLCLALRTLEEAGEDREERRRAGRNLWASILVLAAAVVRWTELGPTAQTSPEEADPLP